MPRLIAFRIAQAIPVMFVVAVLTFLLMHMLPGDPATLIAGDMADQDAIAQVRRDLGLDRPVLAQLWLWITNNAFLFGAEVDAEMERARELQAGMHAEETIQLPPRDTTASDKAAEKQQKAIDEAADVRREAQVDQARRRD